MSHTILLTGASGYLGGTLLAHLRSSNLPAYKKLYALVRTQDQAEAVQQYGAEPLFLNLKDESAVLKTIVDNGVSIVYYLIDAISSATQCLMIEALGQVKQRTGREVHLLHTTGAKLFSSHAGLPTDRSILDTDPELYELQKTTKSPHTVMENAAKANTEIIDAAKEHGVRSYIFAPCIVYGKGEGFGNPISIQTVAIVSAAKKLRRVYKVDSGRPTWPVCHVLDNTSLYIEILRKILEGQDIGHGENGYYLAASGSVSWDDIYSAMAKALAKRQVVDDEKVTEADEAILQRMGEALECPKEFVPVQLGGKCTYQAEHGLKIGWKSKYAPEHILETADDEVELILQHIQD